MGGRHIKIKFFIFLILLTLLFTSGCWSKKEVEDLAIVSAVGIDREDVEGKPRWRLTYQIYKPQASSEGEDQTSGGKGATVWTVSSFGETLNDARMNLNTRTSRIIFSAHTSSIIIGEETARSVNLTEVTDYLLRHKEIRLRNWLLVTEGTAYNMLAVKPELEQNIATELDNIIENTSKRVSKAMVMDLKQVMAATTSPGQDVITGHVEVFKVPKEEALFQSRPEDNIKSIRLHGAAVFSKGRMVGWFDDAETRGYLYILGKAEQTSLPLTLGQVENPNVSLSMLNSRSKIHPYFIDQQLLFKVDIYAEGDLLEIQKGKTVTPDLLAILESKAEEVIKKEAEKAITKSQELGADVFGLGKIVYHKYPRYWSEVENNWQDYYVGLPIDINVKVDIRRTGMITNHISGR